jgi:hypothetical protein
VYFGVAWLLEDHKIGHILAVFRDVLPGDGVIDKGDLGVQHFCPIAFQVFESFYGVI